MDISASIPVKGFIQAEWAKFKAAAKASDVSVKEAKKLRDEQIELSETGETEFERSRRESDEASFERKREFREEETQRFEDIDKERTQAREEQAEAESERFAQIDEERKVAKERETRILQEVFRLRRAGKFDEADELELTIFE